MRRLAGTLVLAAAFVLAAPAAGAESGGANNVVIVQTSTDGSWLARSNVQVVPVAGDTVTSANIADAEAAGCTSCRASAAAVQVLFVTGDPSVFAPGNVAAATNGGCDSCGTFAYAWQYVLQTGGPVFLSAAGRLELQQLRQEIADAVGSLDPTSVDADQQLTAELDSLTAQVKSVVDDELQLAGVHASGSVLRDVRSADPAPAG